MITARGNLSLLSNRSLALFCSIRCPGNVILLAYDLALALRDAGVTVISGFHSPMEKECLAVLLRGPQPIVVCPARSTVGMRLPPAWHTTLASGRLLLLSPFEDKHGRVTADLAWRRNAFVAALADEVLCIHAERDGRLEHFCRDIVAAGKPLLTIDSSGNEHLIACGATPIKPSSFRERWQIPPPQYPAGGLPIQNRL